MRKLTFEYVKNFFEKENCVLMEDSYINNRSLLKYRCSCGTISKTYFSRFKGGNRCKKCGIKKSTNKRRFSYEYVKKCFKDWGCELLEDNYINSETLMLYRCSCGNISKIKFSHFQQGHRCRKCGSQKTADKKRLSFKYVYNFFKKENCELLETEYKNNFTLLKYRCRCKSISKICFNAFKSGHRCSKCSGKEKPTFEYVYNFFKKENCELLEIVYLNCYTSMKYRCSCKNISKISFFCFKKGQRCKKCGYKKNKKSGKDHYNYNPNITDEERKQRKRRTSDPRNKKWRKKVFKKNNYTCQKCSIRGGDLRGHHIKNWSSNKKLRYVVSNGITLCLNCHKDFHRVYGNKNNNQQQLDEFFKKPIIVN